MRTKDENKSNSIYKAAMEVVSQDGMSGASVSKIAKAAGVSSSTIYIYFENKEDMMNKLYIRFKEESCSAFLKGFLPGQDVKENLSRFLKNMFQYMRDNPVQFSFHEQFFNSPNISCDAKDEGAKFYAPLFELYEQGVQEKILKNYPVTLVRAFIFPPIMDLVKADTQGEMKVTSKVLDQAVEMIWDAVSV